jgi:GT2 family glycosyltransferase
MTDHPDLSVAFLTYERTDYALATIAGIAQFLHYQGNIAWYVADDGSRPEHFEAVMGALRDYEQTIIGCHNERRHPGRSWNIAIKHCLQVSDFIFWLEDDWELREPFDISPYVRLLIEKPEVGMVRMGYLPVGLHCEVVGHDGRHYLNIFKDRQYTYSGNPGIRHRRHFDSYGVYSPDTKRSAGEQEVFHDYYVRTREGPQVWWPVDLGGWGIFHHLGDVRT